MARVLWLGTYESDYARTRVLLAGLRELGVEVVERHEPVWERTRHKAGDFLSARRLPATGARYTAAWARIAPRLRGLGRVDAVVAGYPAQLDAPGAWLAARALRAPLVLDAMISLSDTLSGDRRRSAAQGAVARVLYGIDAAGFRMADVVITDTQAHADFFAEHFGVQRDRLAVVPVGAEPGLFPPVPPPAEPPRALFYGKLAPLHGLDTLLAAARRPGVPPVRLIGDGQLGGWLAAELARDRPPNLEHVPWVDYEQLGTEIARAAIALGVFGTSAKAARVIPNKVFQAMAVGRPVVTADTPAVRELLTDGVDALLVPAGDADALAAALTRLAGDAALRERLGTAAHRRYAERALPAVVARRFLDALARAPRLSRSP